MVSVVDGMSIAHPEVKASYLYSCLKKDMSIFSRGCGAENTLIHDRMPIVTPQVHWDLGNLCHLLQVYVFDVHGPWDHYTTLCLGVLVPSQTPNLTLDLYCMPDQMKRYQ